LDVFITTVTAVPVPVPDDKKEHNMHDFVESSAV